MFELEKNYNAGQVEEKWLDQWLTRKAFHADPDQGGKPYTIMIPPPNVTGILHMGHALNNTIQDILIRQRRMQGYNALWIPGTDHAGIATQNVVEKALRKEGKHREDLGREAFVERVWEWKEQYGSTIIRQLKRLGASCDWDRQRFTMDEGLSDAVAEVFIRLYNKRLIYRGNYIINWCPRCRTALSDEESEHVDTQGQLYHIRYLRKGGKKREAVVVATTRPETLLGDVAVAVNPRDERYLALTGQTVILPVLNRELPVIPDDYVDPEFGTGVVKVTPAHDPNDFDMGTRHQLTPINVMNEDGTMNENAGPYQGLDRFECRRRLVEDLNKAGLIEKIDPHAHAVGHCYRCDTVVEPRLSPQWFVSMKPLARPAIDVVNDGRIQFIPERWTKVYLEWMENIRDWCISRQIWWGHRIPVFYCTPCGHEWAAKGKPTECPQCRSIEIRQDPDVLDTWFSSWLWPFTTLGWPERSRALEFYYPTDSLVTASEIIFFWVARMIMAGSEFMGDIPFRKVHIHGTVRDDSGRKMSKSLGNSIDPLDVIRAFSADALRFSLTMLTAVGQDVYISNDKFEVGRNFLTKIWNAARFMQMNGKDLAPETIRAFLAAPTFEGAALAPDDKHILAKLQTTIAACDDHLERFRFNDAAKELYDFIWHHYCDWYIEYAKIALNGEDAEAKARTLRVMHYVFSSALKLLHPIAPFMTEELWHGMGYGEDASFILHAAWPQVASPEQQAAWGISQALVNYVEHKRDLIRIGRTLRADCGIAPSLKIRYIIKPETEELAALLTSDRASIAFLLKADPLVIDPAFVPARSCPSGLNKIGALWMPIDGVVDVAAEIKRISEQINKVNGELAGVNRKLNNLDFVSKAPSEVVEIQKRRQQDMLEKCEKLQRLLAMLTEQAAG